jgi:hypothetical protein
MAMVATLLLPNIQEIGGYRRHRQPLDACMVATPTEKRECRESVGDRLPAGGPRKNSYELN